MPVGSLILVRHGRPEIEPNVSPPDWVLSRAGRHAAAALAEKLAVPAPVAAVSSPEPKAWETTRIIAARLGLTVTTDAGLGEHRRPEMAFGAEEDFQVAMVRVFAEPALAHHGGESADEARTRFEAALGRHLQRPLLVGTHGTVLSLFVAKAAGLDAHGLWRSLTLPEAVVLAADGAVVARLS